MPRSSDVFASRVGVSGRHAGRGVVSAGGAAALGAALVFGAGPAAAETDCFAATDAMTAGRWAEAPAPGRRAACATASPMPSRSSPRSSRRGRAPRPITMARSRSTTR